MAYLLLVLTVLFWAGNFILARAMHFELPPVSMAFFRWLLALLIILPWLVPRIISNWPVIRENFGKLIFFGVVGVAGFNTQIYLGVQETTATNAVLMQSMIPILILLICALFLGEKGSVKQWVGVFLSFCGVTFLVARGDLSVLAGLEFNQGDLWIVGAVLVWAVYSVALRWKPENLDIFTFFGVTVIVAVVTLAPLAWWESGQVPAIEWNWRSVSTIAYMAVFPSVLSYLFWNKGVAELGAPVAGLFIHLLPVFGLLLSLIFLNESLYAFHFWGVALIFAGIYLAVISDTLKRIRLKN
ncbi:MAG: DMT family transporter [Pontibacterium sp.]